MAGNESIIYQTDTPFGHYEVVDTIYTGRPARVLYSGSHLAAQSGVAQDDNDELLFDYNQRLLELVLGLLPQRILIIGGGAYTLPMALLDSVPGIRVDVVEIDPKLQTIARQYFDLRDDARLRLITDEGKHYLTTTSEQYDLIIVDAFSGELIPESLRSRQAIEAAHSHLRPGGMVAMNLIASYYGRRGNVLQEQLERYSELFAAVTIFPAGRSFSLWLPQNMVLISQVGPVRELNEYMRYQSLRPLGFGHGSQTTA